MDFGLKPDLLADVRTRLDNLIYKDQLQLVRDRGGDDDFILSNITDRLLAEIEKTHSLVKKDPVLR